MSLTQHLTEGPLAQWFSDHRSPRFDELAGHIAHAAETAGTARLDGYVGDGHFPLVGTIVGQRLAHLVEPAPPYASLLGAMRCHAITTGDAGRACRLYPTHQALADPADDAFVDRAVHVRTQPSGWRQVEPSSTSQGDREGWIQPLLYELGGWMGQLTPPGYLGTPEQERDLVPYLYLLALLEGVYRFPHIPPELHRISDTGVIEVPERVTEDVLAVLARAEDSVASMRQSVRGDTYLGHAAPVFTPNWAEGDVTVGPGLDGRYVLLDLKVTVRPTAAHIRQWLQQLLAYALLDEDNNHRLSGVGLWLPRQDLVTTVPITQLLDALEGNPTNLVAEFQRIARSCHLSDQRATRRQVSPGV